MPQKVERALEKAVRCYDDDAARLTDIVRQVRVVCYCDLIRLRLAAATHRAYVPSL
jgi:hypothetical protein